MQSLGIKPMTFLTVQWKKTKKKKNKKNSCGTVNLPVWSLDSPVWYKQWSVEVIFHPSVVKHLQVFVTQNLIVLRVVCPQDDSEVEANGKQKTQSEVAGKEGDGQSWLATVSSHRQSRVLF